MMVLPKFAVLILRDRLDMLIQPSPLYLRFRRHLAHVGLFSHILQQTFSS